MHVGEPLTEDGVYGKKTEQVVGRFFDELFRGLVHALTWVNPLQSSSTGITSEPIIKNGETIFAPARFVKDIFQINSKNWTQRIVHCARFH